MLGMTSNMQESNDGVQELHLLLVEIKELTDKFISKVSSVTEMGSDAVTRAESVITQRNDEQMMDQTRNFLNKVKGYLTDKLLDLDSNLKLLNNEIPKSTMFYSYPPVGQPHIQMKFVAGKSPWNFWLCDTSVDTKTLHKNLMIKYQNNLLECYSNPKPSESVCFLDGKRICRGILIESIDKNRVRVMDCDSYFSKVVTNDRVYQPDQDACAVHASVIQCTIDKESDATQMWNEYLRDMFSSALSEAVILVKILEKLPDNFPNFLVDVEMHLEENKVNLKEWIVGRLLPELKKLSTDDFISAEYLNPYWKSEELVTGNNGMERVKESKEVVKLIGSEGMGKVTGNEEDEKLKGIREKVQRIDNEEMIKITRIEGVARITESEEVEINDTEVENRDIEVEKRDIEMYRKNSTILVPDTTESLIISDTTNMNSNTIDVNKTFQKVANHEDGKSVTRGVNNSESSSSRNSQPIEISLAYPEKLVQEANSGYQVERFKNVNSEGMFAMSQPRMTNQNYYQQRIPPGFSHISPGYLSRFDQNYRPQYSFSHQAAFCPTPVQPVPARWLNGVQHAGWVQPRWNSANNTPNVQQTINEQTKSSWCSGNKLNLNSNNNGIKETMNIENTNNINLNINVMASEFVPSQNRIENHLQTPKPSAKVDHDLKPRVTIPGVPVHIQLKKPTSLIKPGDNLLVLMSYVKSPEEFYVHLITKNNSFLDRLRMDMFKYYNNKVPVVYKSLEEAKCTLGRYCASKWSEDNYWYRAEVVDWTLGDNQVKIYFVDSGNTEYVPYSSLQPLYWGFDKLPMCAQRCHLAKVHPVIKGEPWSTQSIEYFKSKANESNEYFTITVLPSSDKQISSNSLSVLLFLYHENAKKMYDPLSSINYQMVDQGLAWSKQLVPQPMQKNEEILLNLNLSTLEFEKLELKNNKPSTPLHMNSELNAEESVHKIETAKIKTEPLDIFVRPIDLKLSDINAACIDNSTKNVWKSWNPPKEDYNPLLLNSELIVEESALKIEIAKKETEPNDICLPPIDFKLLDINSAYSIFNCTNDAWNNWDPRKEDYDSARNNPALDFDDACVAVSGYSAKDEQRICKFYARGGICWKEQCSKEHIRPNNDAVTTDKLEVYSRAFSQIALPLKGDVISVKVTAVDSLSCFYIQLKEHEALSSEVEDPEEEETLTSLQLFMNLPENVKNMQYLKVPPALGELVLAKNEGKWYRARVISTADNPEVMFVDFGTTKTVKEIDIREMEPRFLHLPFQAIECSLANMVPILNSKLHERGAELLRELILNRTLTAKVYDSEEVADEVCRLQISLQLDSGMDVREWLMAANLG